MTGREDTEDLWQQFRRDHPDEPGWLGAEDERRYTDAEILTVARWLVARGYCDAAYAERLCRALGAGKGGEPWSG
jgi:hypothetical protein